MWNVRKNRLWAAIVACGVGTVFQVLPGGCAEYYTNLAVTSFNFCSVFNCEGGTFFNLCEPNRVLLDCPAP